MDYRYPLWKKRIFCDILLSLFLDSTISLVFYQECHQTLLLKIKHERLSLLKPWTNPFGIMSILRFSFIFFPSLLSLVFLLQASKGACNPNLQVVITHASHVCRQYSFGLPLRLYGMHRKHFDHARLDLLSLVF